METPKVQDPRMQELLDTVMAMDPDTRETLASELRAATLSTNGKRFAELLASFSELLNEQSKPKDRSREYVWESVGVDNDGGDLLQTLNDML